MSLSFENSELLGSEFVAVPMSQNLTLHSNKCLREKTALHLGHAFRGRFALDAIFNVY